jgi:hypothetical protein
MRRWSVPVLGVAAALLFGYVATHRVPVPDAPPPRRPAPTVALLPTLDGDRAAGPTGLRVLVSGADPQLMDAATGAGRSVPGLRLGPGERARLLAVPAGTVATVTGPGPTRAALLPASGPMVPLGVGVAVLPARTGTDLWVAGPGPGAAADGGTTGTAGAARTRVRLVSRTGATRRSFVVPGQLTPLRDTAAGLLVTSVGDGRLAVLDPATGQPRARLAAGVLVVAVGPTAVAHVRAGCADRCPLVVTPLAGGPDRAYGIPAGTPGGGAFSPDGRWLALAVPGQYRNGRLTVVPGGARVLDLRSGAVTEVPGVRTGAEREPDVSWFGDALVLAVWSSERGRLAVWTPARPGPLSVLRAELPGDDRFSTAVAVP